MDDFIEIEIDPQMSRQFKAAVRAEHLHKLTQNKRKAYMLQLAPDEVVAIREALEWKKSDVTGIVDSIQEDIARRRLEAAGDECGADYWESLDDEAEQSFKAASYGAAGKEHMYMRASAAGTLVERAIRQTADLGFATADTTNEFANQLGDSLFGDLRSSNEQKDKATVEAAIRAHQQQMEAGERQTYLGYQAPILFGPNRKVLDLSRDFDPELQRNHDEDDRNVFRGAYEKTCLGKIEESEEARDNGDDNSDQDRDDDDDTSGDGDENGDGSGDGDDDGDDDDASGHGGDDGDGSGKEDSNAETMKKVRAIKQENAEKAKAADERRAAQKKAAADQMEAERVAAKQKATDRLKAGVAKKALAKKKALGEKTSPGEKKASGEKTST